MYNNLEQLYSIEMIVVDEQGTTMQANLLHRWISRFESILNELDCYYIVKPTIGLNESKYKYVENQSKLGIYCDTEVYRCNQFSGPTYGFSFTNFKGMVEQTIPENEPLDVIGFVADVGDPKKIITQRGDDTKKLNVVLQDLQMKKIYLSLWGSNADMMLEHWEKREQDGVIVVILQFGSLKYFGSSAFVDSCFSVSKLFINSDIDEITFFRNSLLEKSAASSCSTQSSKLSGMFLSLYDEFVVRSKFNNIAKLNLH
ncbi:uncharacterized protein LOC143565491 [Bidens hawaiensis]|uniref:uncharacterized protein LOC143565491 n=1 Tax=Bidens hawaiensis TaxID=980011 RepID=UPI004049CF89